MRTGIDCFAGIGGFSLAMQRCGVTPKVQIEIDEFCQKILEKNFPKAKRFRDICTVSNGDLRRYRPWILAGGFPCQDISAAGKGAGLIGDRSGLWREMWRLIRTTRPTWLLIENVPALRTRGSDSVLVALEALGYSTWPLVVGALHVGAPHQRQRVWIVGHAESEQRRTLRTKSTRQQREIGIAGSSNVADSDSKTRGTCSTETGCAMVQEGREEEISSGTSPGELEYPAESGPQGSGQGLFAFPAPRCFDQYDWEEPRTIESGLARTIDGLPGRLDNHRIKALGNAIVPQVAEAIIRAIIAVETEQA